MFKTQCNPTDLQPIHHITHFHTVYILYETCEVVEGMLSYLSARVRREWVTVRSSLSPADYCEDAYTHQDFPHSQDLREPANMRRKRAGKRPRGGEERGLLGRVTQS